MTGKSRATGTGPASVRVPFYVNRNFALLWAGQAVSDVGDFLFITTVVLWIGSGLAAGRSSAPLMVSGALAANIAPVVLLGPLAGVMADRWPEQRTMLIVNMGRAALLLALVATVLLPPGVPWGRPLAVYTVILAESACRQFFLPSLVGLVGDIVPERHRAHATGMEFSTRSLAFILGPSLAAMLFTFGVWLAFLIDALSFLTSFALIMAIEPPRPERAVPAERNFSREFLAGVRFSTGNPVIRALIVAGVIWVLGAAAFTTLNVFFISEDLGQPTRLYGYLTGAIGVGALLGSLLAGPVTRRLGLTRTLWLALLAAGVLFAGYSRLTSYRVALAVLTLMGCANAIGNVTIRPLLLTTVPRELIGRVTAVFTPVVNLASGASVAIAGALAGLLHNFHGHIAGFSFGPVDTIFLGAAACNVIGAGYAFIALHRPERATRARTAEQQDNCNDRNSHQTGVS